MKGVYEIDLGQWPAAAFLITDKRSFAGFHRKRTGINPPTPFPSRNGGCTIYLEDEPYAIMIIAIGPQADRDEFAITLAHEATHTMQWVLDHAGEQKPGTETQAYLVEHIVRQCLKAVPA